MTTKINTNELVTGMFVESLDRPWIETPYLIEGLLIQSQADIDQLSQYCKYVYIVSDERPVSTSKSHIIPEDDGKKTLFHGDYEYVNTQVTEKELPEAKKAMKTAEFLMDRITLGIERNLQLDFCAAKELVDTITLSMTRNLDAMLLLQQLESAEPKQHNHAINVSVHMIAFGRHLCLPAEELAVLGLGGLLMDIGRIKCPVKKSDRQQNLPYEISGAIDNHVQCSLEMLLNIKGIPDKVMEIAAQHHEREDGSGYPEGLRCNLISPYAKMAAIVDSYDQLVSGLNLSNTTVSPVEALKILWGWSRAWLNITLVQQFAHSIGIFPVGSLVELNTGEVAVVLSHNRTRRFQPRVMVVLNAQKKPYDSPWALDLESRKSGDESAFEIVKDLQAGSYNIDPKKYFL